MRYSPTSFTLWFVWRLVFFRPPLAQRGCPVTPSPLSFTPFLNNHYLTRQVDDYGWNNVGFHAKTQANSNEVSTPHIDSLAATGIILDRFYAYRFCSPSRSSFLTGRNCIHVNTGNDPLTLWNPADPVSGYAGIPINMTAIASKLAGVGYNTIQSGKWHVRNPHPNLRPQTPANTRLHSQP